MMMVARYIPTRSPFFVKNTDPPLLLTPHPITSPAADKVSGISKEHEQAKVRTTERFSSCPPLLGPFPTNDPIASIAHVKFMPSKYFRVVKPPSWASTYLPSPTSKNPLITAVFSNMMTASLPTPTVDDSFGKSLPSSTSLGHLWLQYRMISGPYL